MGNKPSSKNKKLKSSDIEISCDALSHHLDVARDRKISEIVKKEQDLKKSLTEGWKIERDVFMDIIALVKHNKQIKAISVLQQYAQALKMASMRIISAIRKNSNDKIEDLYPMLQTVLWSAERLDLRCLHEFHGFVKDKLGSNMYKNLDRFDKVNPEFKENLSSIESAPVEVIQYLEAFSERQQIIGLLTQRNQEQNLVEQPETIQILKENSVLTFDRPVTPKFNSVLYDSSKDNPVKNRNNTHQSKSEIVNPRKDIFVGNDNRVQAMSFVNVYTSEMADSRPERYLGDSYQNPTLSPFKEENPKSSQEHQYPILSETNEKVTESEIRIGEDYLQGMIASNLMKESFQSKVQNSYKSERSKNPEIVNSPQTEDGVDDLITKLKDIGVVLYNSKLAIRGDNDQIDCSELDKSCSNDYRIDFSAIGEN